MKTYYLTVLGYYNNSDSTRQTWVICDGVQYSQAGCYEFWIKQGDSMQTVAYYPIKNTIITSIEDNNNTEEDIDNYTKAEEDNNKNNNNTISNPDLDTPEDAYNPYLTEVAREKADYLKWKHGTIASALITATEMLDELQAMTKFYGKEIDSIYPMQHYVDYWTEVKDALADDRMEEFRRAYHEHLKSNKAPLETNSQTNDTRSDNTTQNS